ncbi:hypothetical protein AAZX31_03G228100 [Glycine max]|uniref:Secreted protein n=2 Tax=Glycine subgen. Soja TaxID=1462606 RepID=I1JRQ4_SOYBN|nr:hypothetical protein JHK87_008316 [Glycine soja]KAG5056194.1 hypothetical protein JHK85_008704 [Glycine max]KAG5073263.1 hypothetical protein JHK86_008474 [Glycine max]KAH1071720.1 hypothetical protein GYH30_008294 [Glycine max]KAH1259462.1 hypothetical protein GmHk_03G008920 [Glycine max]
MGCCYMKLCVLTTMILVLSLEKTRGTRTLEGEQWLHNNLVLHSLQRGPVRSSQRNPCSTVPGRSRGRCTLGEINVAGHHHAPPLFQNVVPKFGAALPPSIDANDHTPKDLALD